MLNIEKMIESAKACLGWPYESPGSNDQNGIDCSGLFKKIYSDQGASIAHGSNTIWRKYCGEKGPIESVSQLRPGMAVFKWKEKDTEKYPDGLGDFCHIGLVVSANPLQIIHASSAAVTKEHPDGEVTTDTKLGKWKYWAKLKAVDYGYEPEPSTPVSDPSDETSTPSSPSADEKRIGILVAESGFTVNMRQKNSMKCRLYDVLPVGSMVEVIGRTENGWYKVNHGLRKGWYIKCEFVQLMDDGSSDEDLDTPGGGMVTLIISGLTEEEADELLRQYPKAQKTYG